ncbi:MAG: DUF11 domain-containing protein [Chloroflexi bacterium]|nr:DUF11 domain-containing protein [Chloroflexota bacterium]
MAETLTKIPRSLSFYVAALALAALVIGAAALLPAGPAQARVDFGTDGLPETEINVAQQNTVPACDEEEKPGPNTVEDIRQGYYAVFDAFFVADEGHLSNNFCPPGITVEDDFGTKTYTRHNANIHISKTAFSIPDSYQVTVIDSRPSAPAAANPGNVEGPTIDIAKFPFLADAVSAVKTKDGSTVFAKNKIWWVKLDGPGTSPLQIGYSTALMNEADWYNSRGEPVQFEFSAMHVFQDGTKYTGEELHELGTHFFAFDPGSSQAQAEWSSYDTNINAVKMQTGQYRQMQFAFTKPGTYRVQAHVKGHVRKSTDPAPPGGRPDGWEPVSPDDTITSPVQWYTFHVGSQADQGVTVTAGDVTTTAGAMTLPITVTATNHGPDAAQNVSVEVNLPPGLNAPSNLEAGTINSCGVVAWEIGDMAAGASRSLTFDASVDPNASGKHTVTTEIRTTTYDPETGNNSASVEKTLSGTFVRAPYFPGVTRDIVEHAVAGAHAGDPVAAVSPDGRDLTYTLTGRCHEWFQVHPHGQIVLAANKTLDYDKQWEFPLTLHVSDRVNTSGAADTAIDDSMPVTIRVLDSPDDAVHPTVSFTLSNGDPANQPNFDINRPKVTQKINITASVDNPPTGATLSYSWSQDGHWDPSPASFTNVYKAYGNIPASLETYTVHVKWPGGGISATKTIQWYPKE